MIKVTVKTKQGDTWSEFETLEKANVWIDSLKNTGAWGLPERWLQDSPMSPLSEEDKALALDTRTVERMSGQVTEYLLPAEYSVEVVDITQQVEQDKANKEALAYLASTDWYITRQLETGIQVPVEVSLLRAAARAKVVR